jgi:hypothetical protein
MYTWQINMSNIYVHGKYIFQYPSSVIWLKQGWKEFF